MPREDDPAAAGGLPPRTPPDVPVSAGFLLLSLGRRVREEVEQRLREHGSSLRHVSALGHLLREPGLSYSELGRRAGVTPQSMQATLAQLEEAGAVERRTLPGRGRRAQLHVTPLGAGLLRRGQDAVASVEEPLLAALDDQERSALTAALLKVASAGFPGGPAGPRTPPGTGPVATAGPVDRPPVTGGRPDD